MELKERFSHGFTGITVELNASELILIKDLAIGLKDIFDKVSLLSMDKEIIEKAAKFTALISLNATSLKEAEHSLFGGDTTGDIFNCTNGLNFPKPQEDDIN
jgi:hypothetical protein